MREVTVNILFILIVFSASISLDGQDRRFEDSSLTEKVDSLSALINNTHDLSPSMICCLENDALTLLDKINTVNDKAKIIDALGVINGKLPDFNLALKYHFHALALYEQADNKKGCMCACSNIGTIYRNIENYQLALNYFLESLEGWKKLNDSNGMRNSMQDIALTYYTMGEYDSALVYYSLAQKVPIDECSEISRYRLLNLIANVYIKLQDFENAQNCLNTAKDFFMRNNYTTDLAATDLAYVQFFLDNEQVDEAGIQLAKLSKILPELPAGLFEKDMLYLNYLYYKARNKYGASLQYLEEYNHFEHESNLNKYYGHLADAQYLSDHRSIHESRLLLQKDEIDELRNSNARFSIYLILILFLVVSGIIFLIVIKNKNKRIRNINDKLLEKQKILIQVNDELEKINLKQNKFFKIISHDLKNPFNFLISSSSLLNMEYEILSEEEKKELIKSIEKVSRESFELLANLLKWVSLQSGSAKFELVLINLDQAVLAAIKQISEISGKKKIKIINKINEKIEIFGDMEMITTAVRNLLINAVKYSYEGGEVTVDAQIEKDYVTVSVKDNGIGIDEEVADLLFKFEKSISQYGTKNEKGTGLGLLICKEIVEEHKGEIYFESENNAGSQFYIKLPLPGIK